jgi:hypothetical protein
MPEPYISGERHPACGVCPARRFALYEFDVAERPSREFPFNQEDGHRYTAEGVPVCVHPAKVLIPPGRYKSDGVTLSAELVLPESVDELENYLRETLHSAAPGLLDLLLEKATSEIPRAFPAVDVTETLRRVLG